MQQAAPSVGTVISRLESTLLQEEDLRSVAKHEHSDALAAARALISRKKHSITAVKDRLQRGPGPEVRWKSAFLVAAKYIEVAQRQTLALTASAVHNPEVTEHRRLEQKLLEKECKEVAIELLLDDCEHQLAQSASARDHLYQDLREAVYNLTEIQAYRSASSTGRATLASHDSRDKVKKDMSSPSSPSGATLDLTVSHPASGRGLEPSFRKELALLRGSVLRLQSKLAGVTPDYGVVRAEAAAVGRQIESLALCAESVGVGSAAAASGMEEQIAKANERLSKAKEREELLQLIVEELEQQLLGPAPVDGKNGNRGKPRIRSPPSRRYARHDRGTSRHSPEQNSSVRSNSPGSVSIVGNHSLGFRLPSPPKTPAQTQKTISPKDLSNPQNAAPDNDADPGHALLAKVLDAAAPTERRPLTTPLMRVLRAPLDMVSLLKTCIADDVTDAIAFVDIITPSSLAMRLWSYFGVKLARKYLRASLLPAFEATRALLDAKAVSSAEPRWETVVEASGAFLQAIFDSMSDTPEAIHHLLAFTTATVNARFPNDGVLVAVRLFLGHLVPLVVASPQLIAVHQSVSGSDDKTARHALTLVGNTLSALSETSDMHQLLLDEPAVATFLLDNGPVAKEYTTELLALQADTLPPMAVQGMTRMPDTDAVRLRRFVRTAAPHAREQDDPVHPATTSIAALRVTRS